MYVLQLFSLWTSSSMQMIMTPFALLIRSLLPRDKKDKPLTIWLLTFSQSLANVWAATSPYLIRYYIPCQPHPFPTITFSNSFDGSYMKTSLQWAHLHPCPHKTSRVQVAAACNHSSLHLKWVSCFGSSFINTPSTKTVAKENNPDRWFVYTIQATNQ